MSVGRAIRRLDADAEAVAARLYAAVLGDRLGGVVLLVSLCWFALLWRPGFFSTDGYAYANALVALADGRLAVGTATYGPGLGTPGMHLRDGAAYARNYGVVVAALPVLYAYRALELVVSLRGLALGTWALGLLALARVGGGAVGRQEQATLLGAGLALLVFVPGLLLAQPLPPRWTPVLALGTVGALAAGLTAVLAYRLVARLHGQRVGLATGLAVALASPTALWATVLKRHAFTGLAVLAVLYLLHRSRTADRASAEETADTAGSPETGPTAASGLRYRAGAYAVVALFAWVHAAEALLLGLALVAVDLPTAPRRDARALATVAGAGLLAAVPFVLTNLFVSGSPFVPPRMLASYPVGGPGGSGAAASAGGSGGTGAAAGGGGAGGGGPGLVATVAAALPAPVAALWTVLVPAFVESVALLSQPARVLTVFVRHGYASLTPGQDVAVNLSVLASMPVLGALAAAPVLAVRRWRDGTRPLAGADAVDAFAIVTAALFLGLYLGRLPLHHMLTARYLHPLFPLGAYGLARLPPVRRAVRRGGGRPLALAYAATVPVAVGLHLAAMTALRTTLGEAVQLYALAAVAAGVVLAGWAAFVAWREPTGWRTPDGEAFTGGDGRLERVGPALLGVAAGLVTAYLLVGALSLFPVGGRHLLPPARAAVEALSVDRLAEVGLRLFGG